MAEKRWLRVGEAAEIINVSKKTVYELCASGQLPCTKVGGNLRIDRVKLEVQLERGVQERLKRAAR
jgi:excisionase family DNA binding protein